MSSQSIMKKSFVAIVSLVLCTVMFFAPTTNIHAAWDNPGMPSLSQWNYCEFISPRKITVYRDASCTTQGTCDPARSYGAYISKGDKCYAYEIGWDYVKVNYPTSSRRRTGFIRRSAISDIFSYNPSFGFISLGSIDTHTIDGEWYGYTEAGDTVICCREEWDFGPLWFPIIYTAKNGNRGYKAGWVSLDEYKRILN